MRKFIWLAVVIVVVCLAALQMAKGDPPAQAMDIPSRVPVTATIWSTETPAPSATIDYQVTAIIAQQTADEARRVNAIVTAEFEQRAQAQLEITAAHDQQVYNILSWTATAALTSVPLTATQQYHNNTAIAARQTLGAAQLTATHEAPTQIVAMQQAINYQKYGAVNYLMGWFGIVFFILFVVGIVMFMFTHPMQPPAREEQPTETVIWMRDRKNNGAKSTRYAVPCSPEQLTELSELVINGEKTFGINRLENNSRTLRRGTLYQVREWLTVNGFAVDAGAGQIALNDEGEEFLTAWFDEHKLPNEYDFAEGERERAGVMAEVVSE